MNAYRRVFGESKCPFLVKDNGLLDKYNEIWDKVTVLYTLTVILYPKIDI